MKVYSAPEVEFVEFDEDICSASAPSGGQDGTVVNCGDCGTYGPYAQ